MKRAFVSTLRFARPEHEEGFTLLEVLVALTILSLSVGVLFGIFSQGLARARLDDSAMHARVLAQSLLSQVLAAPAKQSAAGVAPDGYSWRVDIDPLHKPHAASSDDVFAVSVRVSWLEAGQQQVLSLNTLAFGSRDSEP